MHTSHITHQWINCPPGNILNLSLITLRGTRSITTCVHTPTADFLSIYGLVLCGI